MLVSAATAALTGAAGLASLGRHRLKDFPEPRELFAVGPGPHPTPKTLDPLRTNLPSAPTPLVGRDHEVEEITRLLLVEARLVTIVGSGGTGKTRVGLAVADRLLDELPDGAFLIELAETGGAEGVAGTIASALGARGGAEQIIGALSGRELVLMLDNFEHVLDAAPLLSELLVAAPGLRILTTSQAPLRLAEEHIYGLDPLGLPEGDSLEALAEAPATALLVARAQRAARGFRADAGNAAAIAALCRELDGSPLAIELAAARLSLLAPDELLERLRRSPDALGTGGRNLPERQRGLRAAMRWSYGLLDAQAAAVFRRLGHFAGEATLERIEKVCDEGVDDVLESLAQLVDLSLVRRTRDGRFELASALRTYSRELLAQSGESEALNARHADAIIAERLPLALDEPLTSYTQLLQQGMAEQADLVALLEWAVDADRNRFRQIIACSSEALQLSYGLRRWQTALEAEEAAGHATGRAGAIIQIAARHAGEGRGRMLAAALAADTEGHAQFRAWLLGTCAVMDALHLDANNVWMERARAVVAELTASHDPDVLGLARVLEGHLALLEGRFDEAADVFAATLSNHEKSWAIETATYMLGDCHLYAGRPQEALVAYARGVADAREYSARINVAFQGEGVVAALADLGRNEEALEALGANDTLTGDLTRPRDRNDGWGQVMAARIAAARAALGDPAADAAYARGNALGTEAVVELLLGYGAVSV